MRLVRPHIPLSVRCEVALRQLGRQHEAIEIVDAHHGQMRELLDHLLFELSCWLGCYATELHLDHNPALGLRKFNKRTQKYTPDANSPDHLVYRTKEDHDRKTRMRGDHGQYSDLTMMKRERRRKKKAAGKLKPKRKIQSRPFPDVSRPFRGG